MLIRLHATQIARELISELLDERERWAYWLPVLIGVGIAVYFALPFEPW